MMAGSMVEGTTRGTATARKIMMTNRMIIKERTGIRTGAATDMAIGVTIITEQVVIPILFMDGLRLGSARLSALALSAMRHRRIMDILPEVSGPLNRASYMLKKKRTLPRRLPHRKQIIGITVGKRKVTIPRWRNAPVTGSKSRRRQNPIIRSSSNSPGRVSEFLLVIRRLNRGLIATEIAKPRAAMVLESHLAI
jgi:hypothetical protein